MKVPKIVLNLEGLRRAEPAALGNLDARQLAVALSNGSAGYRESGKTDLAPRGMPLARSARIHGDFEAAVSGGKDVAMVACQIDNWGRNSNLILSKASYRSLKGLVEEAQKPRGKWFREEVVSVFEELIKRESPVVTHRHFRESLDRDQNLLVNQMIREANGNIAYETVNFDVNGLEDERFWARIDNSPYSDLIENNAALAMIGMAEKFGLVS